MRVDPIVERRFDELAAKADAVAEQRTIAFTASDSGTRYYYVPSAAFYEWTTNVQNLLARTFGDESIHYRNFTKHADDFDGYESGLQVCRAILTAAREDYVGGYLFDVRALAKAEVLSDALAQGRELLAAGYKDPACILARVALEVALAEAADKRGIARGKIDKMNAELCKAGHYNMAKQKQVTAWADIGNKAAHGEWDAYTDNDARAMLDGVEGVVADLL